MHLMRNRLLMAALAALFLAGSAQAQVIAMRFGQGGVPFALGTGNFIGSPGGTVAIQVFLTDSDSTFRNESGVGSAGVGIHSSNTAIAQVLTTADIVNNPSLNFGVVKHVDDSAFGAATGTPNNPGNSSLQASNLGGLAPTQQNATPSVAQPDFVLIGTFTFHVPAGASGVTNLTVFDWQPTQTNNRTVAGTSGNLDARPEMFLDTARITVAGVPEPGTFALGGLATVGLAAIRRRRKSASTTTSA
jgi:hypothetical protein